MASRAARLSAGLGAFVLLLIVAAARPPTAVGDEGRPVYGRIRGTVVDAADRPLPGLMIQLSSREQSGLLRVTGTDERGRYSFRDLPAGTYEIEVIAAGYRAARKGEIVVRPPFQNIVGFTLQPSDEPGPTRPAAGRRAAPGPRPHLDPVAVRGRFVDQEKRPVPEVSVTLVSLEGPEAFQAFSSEDGDFRIDSVPPGRYRVLISSPGHVALDLPSVEVAPATGLSLGLTLVEYSLDLRDRRPGPLPPERPRRLEGGAPQ